MASWSKYWQLSVAFALFNAFFLRVSVGLIGLYYRGLCGGVVPGQSGFSKSFVLISMCFLHCIKIYWAFSGDSWALKGTYLVYIRSDYWFTSWKSDQYLKDYGLCTLCTFMICRIRLHRVCLKSGSIRTGLHRSWFLRLCLKVKYWLHMVDNWWTNAYLDERLVHVHACSTWTSMHVFCIRRGWWGAATS